ncbi:MAG: TSUP family transporter, partial [Oscillospiraceae bacterium]
MNIILLLVSFLASVVGAICGIGGGVIVKPILDSLSIASVATISFMSGCMVLSMSSYSVVKALAAKESLVDFKTGTPLAVGAAIGGVLGKDLFGLLQSAAVQPERVGGYQA